MKIIDNAIVQITGSGNNIIQMNGAAKPPRPEFRNTPAPFVEADLSGKVVLTVQELRPLLEVKQIAVRMVWATKEIVEELLKINIRNRKIRAQVVAALKESIGNDGWMINGSTVVVSWNGILLDGQHRLTSILGSGRPQMILLVTGIDPAAAGMLGQERSRSVGDKLMILDGYTNGSCLAAACKLVKYFEEGDSAATDGKGDAFTYAHAKEILRRHPGIVDCVTFVTGHRGTDMSPALRAAYLYLFRKVDSIKADYFMCHLGKRQTSSMGDKCPIYALWNLCLEIKVKGQRLKARQWAFLLRNAWKSFYLNQPQAKLDRNKLPDHLSVEVTTFSVEGLPADWATK